MQNLLMSKQKNFTKIFQQIKFIGLVCLLPLCIISCIPKDKYFKDKRQIKDSFEEMGGLIVPVLSSDKMNTKSFTLPSLSKGKPNEIWDFKFPNKYIKYCFKDDLLYEINEYFIINSKIKFEETYVYNLYYHTVLRYYPNGQLSFYKVLMNTGFHFTKLKLGTWYQFDEQGRELKKVEHEQIYSTPIYKLLTGGVFTIYHRVYNNIYRFQDKGKKYWLLNFIDTESNKSIIQIVDDKSGSLLENDITNENLQLKYPGSKMSDSLYEEYFDFPNEQ